MNCTAVAANISEMSPIPSHPSDTAAASPMQASTDSFPSCSLMSCTSSGCDWGGAPFLCLEGGSTGG